MRTNALKKRAIIAALACTVFAAGTSYGNIAQAAEGNEDFFMDQIVVTATRTPVKEFDANANINVITKEKIEQQHYQDLSEALRDVPGVTILNYGRAGYYTSNALRINGSSNVVVLIDGMRAGHAGMPFPAAAYNALENVERIEALKGASSALYGSDAKGGVINIITRKPDKAQSKLTVSGGSFSKENYSLTNEGTDKDWSMVLNHKFNDDSSNSFSYRNSTYTGYYKNSYTSGNDIRTTAISAMPVGTPALVHINTKILMKIQKGLICS